MKNKFLPSWKSSKQKRKQRKYRYNAPLHIKQKFMRSHLSKELIKKYGKRNIGLRKGDKVKIMRGQHKKHVGKIESIDLKRNKAVIEGISITKKDGSKAGYSIDPSNLLIVELNLDDKFRQNILKRNKK